MLDYLLGEAGEPHPLVLAIIATVLAVLILGGCSV